VPQHQRLRPTWHSIVPDTVFQLRLPSQPVTVPPHAGCILLYLMPFVTQDTPGGRFNSNRALYRTFFSIISHILLLYFVHFDIVLAEVIL